MGSPLQQAVRCQPTPGPAQHPQLQLQPPPLAGSNPARPRQGATVWGHGQRRSSLLLAQGRRAAAAQAGSCSPVLPQPPPW